MDSFHRLENKQWTKPKHTSLNSQTKQSHAKKNILPSGDENAGVILGRTFGWVFMLKYLNLNLNSNT